MQPADTDACVIRRPVGRATRPIFLRRVSILASLLSALCGIPVFAQNGAPSIWLNEQPDQQGDICLITAKVPLTTTYTYYSVMNWNAGSDGGGYCGFQDHPDGRNFIFSLWDPTNGIPITAAYADPGTVVEPFGGEGTGLKSWNFTLGWELNQDYTFATRNWTYSNHTYWGYWVLDVTGQKWTHLVTMDYPQANLHYNSQMGQFLEDWNQSGQHARKVLYKDIWKRRTNLVWTNYNTVNFFLNAGPPPQTYGSNYDAGVESGYFYLKTGSNTVPSIGATTNFSLPSSGVSPVFAAGEIAAGFVTYAPGQMTVNWANKPSASPQFSYQISVYDNAGLTGSPIAVASNTVPHRRSVSIPVGGLVTGAAYYVKLQTVDIFDQPSPPVVYSFFPGIAPASVPDACDFASEPAYAGGFTNGSNGGFGFGAWDFIGSGGAFGGFIGNSTQNGRESINVSNVAFGLYANPSTASIDARRTFAQGPLTVGQTFSFDMNYSWNGGARGFALYCGSYTSELGYVSHTGGDALVINGAQAFANVYNQAIHFSITALSDMLIQIQATGAVAGIYTTNVLVSALPDRFKFFYSNTAGDSANESNYEPYFNGLKLTGIPTTRYVALGNPTPVAPYTTWATAATNIQDAIDAADPGNTILVSNGVYNTGGRTATDSTLTNRVFVHKPLHLVGVNGPSVTIIEGKGPNGDAAVRGIWLTNGASLTGFTITNGATRTTGGFITHEMAGGIFGQSASVIVSNCIIIGNTGDFSGGGSWQCTFYNSSFIGNICNETGGGPRNGILYNCLVQGNRATFFDGGGALGGTLYNCLVVGNHAGRFGGGTANTRLINSTIVSNSAGNSAGGMQLNSATNCIIYGNTATLSNANHESISGSYNLTTPLLPGTGNITNTPVFVNAAAGDYRLLSTSPGINAGNNATAPGVPDLDGNPRIAYDTVDMGAYELPFIPSNLVVTSLSDGNAGSLRQVVAAVPAGGTITFDPSLSGQTITLGSRIFIGKNLTIDGSTALDGITLSGGNTNGIFVITNCTVVLDSLTLANAFVNEPQQPNRGGAIYAGNANLTVRNCTIRNNDARYGAAASVYNGTNVFINCTIFQNRSIHTFPSAGAFLTEGNALLHLIHSTVVSNRAFELGGAIRRSDASRVILENSIVALNGEGFYGGPDIWSEGGTNTITIGTNFVGTTSGAAITNFVLTGNPLLGPPQDNGGPTWTMLPATNSPVRNAAAPSGITRDQRGIGRPLGRPDIGAVEVFTNTTFYVALNNPTPQSPYISWATAATKIQAAIDVASPGSTVFVSNGVYQTGGRPVAGALVTNRVVIDKPIIVEGVNGPAVTEIKGAWDPVTTNGDAAVRCVWMTNGATLIGFTLTNGATRKSGDIIREWRGGGVWASSSSATISNCVLTSNRAGQYGGGMFNGTLNNCLLKGNAAANRGGGTYNGTLNNCTLTGNSAGFYGGGSSDGTLNNCTLTGNSADTTGGGAYGSILNNCTLTGNSAGLEGGGASGSILNNCTLTGNSAGFYGGGSDECILNNCTLSSNSSGDRGGGSSFDTLNNCTLSGNSATFYGGGAYKSILNNCIAYFNTAGNSNNYHSGTNFFTCTTPLPPGTGNITNTPMFVDAANSNFTLMASSPCRDMGNNADAPAGPDLAGNARIVNGYVDMGAYEFQGSPQGDYDGDGNGNGDERVAGTDFADSNAFFAVSAMSSGSISFDSVTGRVYAIERNDALMATPQIWIEFTNNIAGTGGSIVVNDPLPGTNRSYRVRVGVAP